MRKFIFTALLACNAVFTQAQQEAFYFRNYQVSDGLSGNAVGDIVQDGKGFMWFASRNGLNRFDGHSFRIFQNQTGDSLSIGSNSIFALYEDRAGRLWVGTHKGVYHYDPVHERFSPFGAIPEGEVLDIGGDNRGNTWVISNLSLYRSVRGPGGTLRTARMDLGGAQAISLHVTQAGVTWVATNDGRAWRYDPQTGRFHIFDIGKLSGVPGIYGAMRLHAVGDSALLVGTMKKTLLLNTRTGRVRNLTAEGLPAGDIQVHTIFAKTPTEYWLGTESGLYMIDLRTGKSRHVVREHYDPYSITDNIINAIFRDREGGIWITTQFGGVNYYSPQSGDFRKYFPKPANSLGGNVVHEICKDRFGKLWIGTEDAGLSRLDLQTGVFKAFRADGKPGSISYRNIHGMVADGDHLWVGTYEHGLDVIDLRTERVVRHYNASADPRTLSSNFIVTMYRTRSGDILAGTWMGLCRYNRDTDDFTRISDTQVQSIHEDEDGTIWTASYGRGVYYFNPKTQKKGHITHSPDGLPDNYVNSIYQSSDKSIWLCTENGLSRLNPRTGRFQNYRVQDGLPDNQVFRVLEDDAHNFWISTSRGLARLDARTGRFTLYRRANGLPTDQFNYNSSFRDADGTLYFGTVAGLVGFTPATMVKNAYVPPVYISRMQVNNRDIDIHQPGAPFHESISYAREITLPWHSSNLGIDVAVLSYMIPEQNSYRYQMEGLSGDWTTVRGNRRIQFSKLPPGEYVLRIRGANNDGLWTGSDTRLHITILPPFWATRWAYLLYAMVVLTISVVIIRYYFLALNEKNQRRIETLERSREREIYNAKIDFFTNVAHEIRTPLTLIKMPLDKLMADQKTDPQMRDNLTMIDKNTSRLIDLTNQLLDFRKAEANNYSLNFTKTDINELLSDVFGTFRPAAEQKQLQYRLEMPRMPLQAFVDAEACKKIISNLVNNAIKYAETSVKVKLSPFNSDDIQFHIEFSNDGALVSYEDRDRIFEPFYRASGSAKEQGTGIGLPLARSLAELHKGTLQLKRSLDELNTFLLSLPIHQDYELDLHAGDNAVSDGEFAGSDQGGQNADPAKPSVLLVEDNTEILGYLGRELRETYNIFGAGDGRQAIEILENEQIHLVISDIMMPVMDGIALCRVMKDDIRFSHIPIILLTAKNSMSAKIEGLEVGADAYIEKPFAFEHLAAQISNLLHNRNIIKDYFARSPLTHIKGIAFSKADKDFIEQLNAIISDHIADSSLDVELLSSKMNMSRPTLYRKIKGISDMTPNELIHLSRLKKAAELLAEKNYKINEVADMVGYSMATNFSRDFQKQFGVSPSGYVAGLE